MTIAFGVRCPEGVVLVTDSMRTDWSGPRPVVDLSGEKFHWIGERTVMVISGCLPEWRPDGRWAELPAEEVAERAFGELLPLVPSAEETHDGLYHGLDVLVGGTGGLGFKTTGEDSDQHGRLVVAGSMTAWGRENVRAADVPHELGDVVSWALRQAIGYLDWSYALWGITYEEVLEAVAGKPGAPIPPTALPLHAVAITPDEVLRRRVDHWSQELHVA